jgi:hypothetical protein
MNGSQFVPMLAKLAVRRQAELDDAALGLFAEDLAGAGIDARDASAACDALGRAPRAEFQSAFPSLGDLLSACRSARWARMDREQAEYRASLPKQLPSKPISRDAAKNFLAQLKAIVKHGASR